eukprot:s713_g2.t1
MDGRTGASLKLTILNEKGRVWTMVAGGGASVVYADTVADYGMGHELANYGEYSGAPSTEETFVYAKTLLSLMMKYKHPEGKFLIIGGGIANFTDVAATFTGLIKALQEYADDIKASSGNLQRQMRYGENKIKILIRRAGPNYLEGLRKVKAASDKLGLGIKVYGPETHITAIIPMALGLVEPLPEPDLSAPAGPPVRKMIDLKGAKPVGKGHPPAPAGTKHTLVTATPDTTSIVYGMQNRAVQGMLDFDYMCKRPSLRFVKFYWGTEEILMPVYTTTKEAVQKHPNTSVFVNFASFRSVHETTMEAMNHTNLKTIAIIAEAICELAFGAAHFFVSEFPEFGQFEVLLEVHFGDQGVPEQQTRDIIKVAEKKGVGIIGPATVGGIKPGCLRIGNTGGMLDNIVMSRLYRPGSVAYVSKSGGMLGPRPSNELNNIVARNSDGVYEGVAIGPGLNACLQMPPGSGRVANSDDPKAKMLLLLGEVGGLDEYDLIEAKKKGRITKPVIAWCVGTCASCFTTEVQFGHAGAQARGDMETAAAKNKAMKEAGFFVPDSFDKLPDMINQVYTQLVMEGEIVPMDYTWAKKLGMIRKPANFISSISDDHHGPAVSGAHNTIVTARAGKDLVSSLCSGLLTIGPRFGGALDDAAKMFADAQSSGDWIEKMKKSNQLIMGIGHRIKSLANPDQRVEIIKGFAKKNFKTTPVLDYALAEQITTRKRANLILNVDGCIAVSFVDMIRSCGRSIGFIGHYLDQLRLKQPLSLLDRDQSRRLLTATFKKNVDVEGLRLYRLLDTHQI